MKENLWQWDWQEGLRCQAQGGRKPWRCLIRKGTQSDMEAGDRAREAGGGRLGAMMYDCRVKGEGGTERGWNLRVFPFYLSSSYFQSCHHLWLPVLGKAPSHPGPQLLWAPGNPSLPYRGCSL